MAGGNGVNAGLLLYTCLKHPHLLRNFKYVGNPVIVLPALVLWSLYTENYGMMGGMSSVYLGALLFAL